MVYKRSFYSTVFIEKSAVYGEELHASLLGFDSLITMASRIFVSNYDVSNKIQGRTDFQRKKQFFHVFCQKLRKGLSDSFVEWIKLYHNLKVHEVCIFIYQDAELEKKTPKSDGKKVVPNYDAQLIFVPNYDDKPNFVPNYDGCCFCPELQW